MQMYQIYLGDTSLCTQELMLAAKCKDARSRAPVAMIFFKAG